VFFSGSSGSDEHIYHIFNDKTKETDTVSFYHEGKPQSLKDIAAAVYDYSIAKIIHGHHIDNLDESANLDNVRFGEGTRSQYYYEKLADEVFALNPNLDTSGRADDLLNAAFPLMVRDLGSKKRANNLLNYDEDFPSDFVSAYGELKKGAAVNQQSTEGSDELFRIRQLSGM
jgi:hypothetical protein